MSGAVTKADMREALRVAIAALAVGLIEVLLGAPGWAVYGFAVLVVFCARLRR